MKYSILFFLYLISFSKIQSQIIIDYQNWNGGTACNLFASSVDVPCTINGVNSTKPHKTNVGQPRYSSNSNAIYLECESISGINGTGFEILNNFKRNHTYKITVNAARTQVVQGGGPNLVLDINSGSGNGGNTTCNGLGAVTVGGGSSLSKTIFESTFSDYSFDFSSSLSQTLSSLKIFVNAPFNSEIQTVFLRKITIIEVPPPSASCNLPAPTSLGINNNGRLLTWSPPTGTTNGISYTVTINDAGIVTTKTGITETSLDFCPSAIGNNVSFTVQSVCSNGIPSGISNPYSFIVPNNPLPPPTNLSATQGTGSFDYGYHINFTPPIINGNIFYGGFYLEWFDLTTNTTGGMSSIGYSTANDWQNFFYYPPAGHSFKFRLAVGSPCGQGEWSIWSTPQPSNCNLAVDPTTFSAFTTNPGSYHNGYETCVFGALTNAISYEIESQAFNISTAQYLNIMITNSTLNNVNVYTGSSLPTNAGWAFHFRVRAKCANNLWGNYSAWSNNFAL